ncbi:MAG: hypothetical protein KKA62_04200 [Nanoarchaeota archaeon]|nr:hypothetical protein [Nanoarchaeota archaeon]MBU1644524.1 hypothetical protein [Nanoarchaeota archaeon]MBU1977124.1 hypothetical protein [Nanoarchaeota archaeon]
MKKENYLFITKIILSFYFMYFGFKAEDKHFIWVHKTKNIVFGSKKGCYYFSATKNAMKHFSTLYEKIKRIGVN